MSKKIPEIVKRIQNYKTQEINYAFQKGISFSQLSMYLKCPKQYELRYIQKHREFDSSINTVFGSAIHETVQYYLQVAYNQSGVKADSIDLVEYFETKFREIYQEKVKENQNIHFSNPVELNEYYEDAVAILEFIKKNRKKYFGKRGWWLVGVEIPIIISPDLKYKDLLFNGYIDLVLYHESENRFVIYDIKTSRQTWSEGQKKDEIKQYQPLLYKFFFSEQFGIDIDTIDVEFFILKRKIWENSQFPQKRVQQFTPMSGKTKIKGAKDALNKFIEEVFEIDGSYKNKEYIATPSKDACKYCLFRKKKELCSVGIS